jgi:predicted RNase H-like HicB family nuclease
MARAYEVIVERDSEGWYVGTVPALHGCHTQARSLDELRERIREVILLCVEDGVDEGGEDRAERVDFVGIERIVA